MYSVYKLHMTNQCRYMQWLGEHKCLMRCCVFALPPICMKRVTKEYKSSRTPHNALGLGLRSASPINSFIM